MKQYIDTKYGVNSVLFANGIDKPENHDVDIIRDKYGLEKIATSFRWEELFQKKDCNI